MGAGASKDADTSSSADVSKSSTAAKHELPSGTTPTPPNVSDGTVAPPKSDGDEDGIYDGFLVETSIKFDLSVPTNAVDGAMALITVVQKLIQAFVNRNKFMRAMEVRVHSIESAVKSLQSQQRNLTAALPALQTLVRILFDFKQFVQYVTKKPDNFFEKAVNFFRAKSDLENLAEFDALFTRALADLNVPLQADQIAMMSHQRDSLVSLSSDVARVLAKLDETKVLTISKKVLTQEESLAFWMDCFPDKFQVPVKEFVVSLKVWFEECRGMHVNKKSIDNIVTAINLGEITSAVGEDPEEDSPDDFIDAREANLLFSALPDGYATMNFNEVVKVVADYVKQRRLKEIQSLKDAREKAARKLANISQEVSDEEKQLRASLGNLFYVRFLCQGSTVTKMGEFGSLDVSCLYIVENGSIVALGKDRDTNIATQWNGKLFDDLSMELFVPSQEEKDKTVRSAGEFRGNVFVTHCCHRGGLCVYYLRLPALSQWEGYWELPTGDRGDMFLFLGEHNGVVDGISDDSAGVAVWRGTITKEEFTVTKKYLNQHFVEYKGSVKVKPNGLRVVTGEWSIPGNWSGVFSLWESLL